MTITVSAVDLTCSTVHNGSVTAMASDGIAPYHYEWNTQPPQFTATATQLGSGNYWVEVTDAGGCIDTASVSVWSPPPIQVAISTTSADCHISNGNASKGKVMLEDISNSNGFYSGQAKEELKKLK